MKLFYSILLSFFSILGYSQTILHQPESTTRTVQDPQVVVLGQGFRATSGISNPFIAKIGGPATENPGGGPTDSQTGVSNPSGTISPQGISFHDTKGNVEVNGAGQLQFTLPIALPPGVKNVAPQINLAYTSGSSNGIAGYGWGISGITNISRIAKNIEKNREISGIQLNYSDYYNFNGQRLILKSGDYGKDGAEYVTEKYSNIIIKSVGSVSGQNWQGPEYWQVTFEDGSQAWYGALTTGNSSARTPIEYNIVKWEDIQGNYISYNYVQTANVSAISNIEWGGNEKINKPHFNTIQFTYVNRKLNEIAYVNGTEFIQNKLLKNIEVKSNQNKFKKYSIDYEETSTSYQFVKNITEINADEQSATPVNIEYYTNAGSNEETIYQNAPSVITTKKYGDFNMDGTSDYLEFVSSGNLNFKNSIYSSSNSIISLQYDSSKFNLENFKNAIPLVFKKDNYVTNKMGIVVPVPKNTSVNYKKDYEFQVYSIDIQNHELHFEYSKTMDYDSFTPFSNDDDLEVCMSPSSPSILEAQSYDFNGDGIPELLIKFRVTRVCGTITNDPGPVFNNTLSKDTFDEEAAIPLLIDRRTNTEGGQDENIEKIGTGQTMKLFHSYIFFDLDQNLTIPQSVYRFETVSDLQSGGISKIMTADLNGDGVQEIIAQANSQFSSVFNIKRDETFTYSKENVGNFAGYNFVGMPYSAMMFGDFNGDAKADIIVPQANHSNIYKLYISNGNNFNISSISLHPYQTNPLVLETDSHNGFPESTCVSQKINYYQYDVSDLDGDGKSEIIITEFIVDDHEWASHNDRESTQYRVSVYSLNKIDNFNLSLSNNVDSSGKYTFYQTRVWNKTIDDQAIYFSQLSLNRENQQIILVGKLSDCSGNNCNYIVNYGHPYLPTKSRIKSITQGGIITTALYQELNPNLDSNFYKPVKKEEFPFYELENVPYSYVISKLIQTGVQQVYQDFRYRGMISHFTGKGIIGFRQSARSSWYATGHENTKIWSGIEIDVLNESLPIKEWSIRTTDENKIFPTDISEGNSELISFKSTSYQTSQLLNGQVITTVGNNDKPKIVTSIVPKISRSKNFLTNIITEENITYGEYYLPINSITNINSGYAINNTTFEYYNNISGIASDYYIGRPKTVATIMQAYGDSKSNKEEYIYENNFLKTLKTWNRDNTAYLLETYNYDDFGNITQKTNSNSIDSQIQTSKAEYDSKGRFIEKKTDNFGLVTNIVYNNWGQVLTQTDPINNVLTNTYDNWGKLLTSKSNLKGTTTYHYEKDSNLNTILTQYDPDGDISKKYTNRSGQDYLQSSKAFGAGQYVHQQFSYDLLGRKVAEREPYNNQSPVQWNITAYDDTTYPAKVTSTSFTGKKLETTVSGLTTTMKEINPLDYGRTTSKTTDALGNVISITDKGGTITFSYNAAGEQIKTQYAENIVITKYDSWGRKSEFNDPSNGLYKYEYNGFGQPTKIISPKGTKEYIYNNLGQLIKQNEISTADGGQATNKIISYNYDDKARLIGKIGTSKGKTYSSTILYDQQGRVLSSSENSNGRYFIEKGITYDDKARVISYEKQLYSSGIMTKVQIENVYSVWNGELYQVKDKDSGKILWELQETNAKGQVLKSKLGAANINNLYDTNGFLTSVNHSSIVKPSILQLTYSFNAIKNELNSKTTGGDFNITETFDYDDNNRLINWTNPVTGIKPSINRNIYDIKGRILENDQVGTIKYENFAKIYQPTGMTLNTAGSQNYSNDLIQSILYNENNDPVFINGEKGDVAFEYGLSSMRQKVTYGGNFNANDEGKFTKIYSEDGSYEVLKDNITGKEKHTIYIDGNPYESDIIYLKNYDESTGSYKFLHKDYIGSILAISDEAGNKLEQRHFDAWGNFTHLQTGSGAVITDKNIINTTSLLVDRGYTSHEHFAEVGIIHMNGRLYDPLLRRFLNADENIQDPYNTQNYNKYGYVMNNPLMFNDPGGEFIQVAAAAVLFWQAVAVGTYIAFASYLVVTAYLTKEQITLKGGLQSIFYGAVSSAATFGIGSAFSSAAGATQFAKSLGDAAFLVQAAAHGITQGTLSLMQNGTFQQGFFSGFFGSVGASAFGAIAGDVANSTVGTIAFGAVAGGVGSELTGGNFWQGAVIGGFVAGFNHVMHKISPLGSYQEDPKDKKKPTLPEMKESPPDHPEFKAPKGGNKKVRNPNGRGTGWLDNKGRVWVPDDHNGTHAPHWDRQEPKGGGYSTVYPTVKVVVIGTAIIVVGIKLLDRAASRLTPFLMTPIMQMQMNQQSDYKKVEFY
ncbi:RHS repeat-associated core domain-containing protein [Chryseobacterium chendengshani]|uniref:RHS repeat-associated core domain-containing protein n=1 Tax=Chryseobacterium sp. LJ756 TaxID=2864113 RepID=UPI001C63CEB2|nr:RHS repeat-associated core domain-containing protein [Chryseobacterium sp. LJ756]MBW7675116.1 FG-GAP-like repeat-containing protein [Chryseobacterium sp. LJ756]